MIVSHIVQCKAAVQVAPDATIVANTTADSDANVADVATADATATDASVTDAAFTALDADVTAPDAAPNHVRMALRKALMRVPTIAISIAHNPPIFFATLKYREGERQISRMLKLGACLQAKLLNSLVLQKQTYFLPPRFGIDSRIHHQAMGGTSQD